MKKNLLFIVAIFGVIGLGIIFFTVRSQSGQKTTPTPSDTIDEPSISKVENGCTQNELRVDLAQQGAAGSIYGDITVTNTSSKTCTVMLGDTISLTSKAENVSGRYQIDAASSAYQLKPSEKLYSRVRIPNGPQCQSEVSSENVTFVYQYENIQVSFQPIKIQACSAASDETIIDIWPLSKTPITS